MDNYHRSLRNRFTNARLQRMAEHRSDTEWLRQCLSLGHARFMPVHGTGNLFSRDDPFEPVFLEAGELEPALMEQAIVIFLGIEDGLHYFGLELTGVADGAEQFAHHGVFDDLQSAGVHLDPHRAGLLAYAKAMANWHQNHRFCPRCGQRTHSEHAGHVRVCGACGAQHFPRTDPAVIVLAENEQQCLLGRQRNWPPKLYSAIAGFVEPGETIEQTVVREVKEETGVDVVDVQYASSQPWPFPCSLMLGFNARAVSREIRLGDEELADAQWFSRASLAAGLANGDVALPNTMSIAHRLVEDWFDRGGEGSLSDRVSPCR